MFILLVIGIILFILWLLGLFTSRTMGGLIHIALIVALILVVLWLLRAVFHVF